MRSESEGASVDMFATDGKNLAMAYMGRRLRPRRADGLVASLRSRGGEAGLHCKDRFWLARLGAGSLLYER